MTIQETLRVLTELEASKNLGGKPYKDISKLMSLEATTHNITEARNQLIAIKEKYNGKNK